jgi:hypothetical protein
LTQEKKSLVKFEEASVNVLAIDIGGNNVKILATGQTESRRFLSGTTLTPKQMVAGVKKLAGDWKYDVVSIGYPGMVVRNRLLAEPHNLGRGWMEFDFAATFKQPVKIVNELRWSQRAVPLAAVAWGQLWGQQITFELKKLCPIKSLRSKCSCRWDHQQPFRPNPHKSNK